MTNYIDFNDLQVFEEATTYPCILSASKQSCQSSFVFAVVQTLDNTSDFGIYLQNIFTPIDTKELNGENWILSSNEEQSILTKIKNQCTILADYISGEAHYGIKTGLTEAFLVDGETRQRMILNDPHTDSILKPVLRGRTMKKWHTQHDNLWLIGTFPVLDLNIDDYPEIKNHLLQFGQQRLEQSGEKESRKKSHNQWFETQDNIAYWQEFEKPKIMYQKFQVKPCFIYDEKGLYCNDSVWIIAKDDKVLLAILNSRMGWWLISQYCTAIQNGFQLIWDYFGKIPIPTASSKQAESIIPLVDRILSAKQTDPDADTIALEEEIDRLVYQLYGLTEEEIAIVENS